MSNKYLLLLLDTDVKETKYLENISYQYSLLTDELNTIAKNKNLNNSIENFLEEILPLLNNHILILYDTSIQYNLLKDIFKNNGYTDLDFIYVDINNLSNIFGQLDISDLSNNYYFEQQISFIDKETMDYLLIFLKEMYLKISSLPLILLQHIFDILFTINSGDALILHDIINLLLHKTNASFLATDLLVANKIVLKKLIYEVYKDTNTHINPEMLLEFFANNNLSSFSEYEMRPQQQQILDNIKYAIDNEKHLIIEAGTGTGKTLAYLLPTLYQCLKNEKKAIVSTNTIVLQSQIFNNDIKIIEHYYGLPINAVILKGRSNYICLRKFHSILNNIKNNDNYTNIFIAKILVWLSTTQTGDKEEIEYYRHRDWLEISSDTESCLNRKCLWFSNCFYFYHKNKANTADLIITNHSMVFADIKAQHQVLPKYDYIVFDEAHHIENEATKYLGFEINYVAIKKILRYMYRNNRSGLLIYIKNQITLLEKQSIDIDFGRKSSKIISDITQLIIEFSNVLDEFILLLQNWIRSSFKSESDVFLSIRFTDKVRNEFPYFDLVRNIDTHLNLIINLINKLEIALNEIELDDNQLVEQIKDLLAQNRHIKQLQFNLKSFFENHNDNYVYWIEADFNNNKNINFKFYAAPIEIGNILTDNLFEKVSSCILLSATIAINGSFDYVLNRLGLKKYLHTNKIITLALESPFDYINQSIVYLPTDMPEIERGNDYINYLVDTITNVAIQFNGKTLILFTANDLLNIVYNRLKNDINIIDNSINIIAQNIDSNSKTKLINHFYKNDNTVLLGTNSFWEGIDIPGLALSCVCIIRLPFWPPNLPIVEARSELIKKNNGSPFIEYSLPEAIIRFKQGFGRLIRSKSDKGVAIIFDNRILTKNYGKKFLNALPGPNIKHSNTSNMINELSNWFN